MEIVIHTSLLYLTVLAVSPWLLADLNGLKGRRLSIDAMSVQETLISAGKMYAMRSRSAAMGYLLRLAKKPEGK
jgi:hypothetical protein